MVSETPAARITSENHSATQFQAGYVLEAIKESFAQTASDLDKINALLSSLCYFDIDTDLNLFSKKPESDSIVAVLSNIISRGLPTKPSIFIEETFANTFGMSQRQVDAIEEELGEENIGV